MNARVISSLALIASSALLASCVVTSPSASPGHTEYLRGINVAHPQHSRPVDTVSYWDGDGVSGSPAITIDLSQQRAFFFKGQKLVGVSRISSGDEKHQTPTGNFKITEKDVDHRSNLYGDFVDAGNNVVVRDVAVKTDTPPQGTHFLGAAMDNFLRFNAGIGMHSGFLPGYAASHGCIRMPDHMAKIFFNNVSYGTPVSVVD